jgi:hypothetical protein
MVNQRKDPFLLGYIAEMSGQDSFTERSYHAG